MSSPPSEVFKNELETSWQRSYPMCQESVVTIVQLLSHVWLFVTPWTAARQTFPCPSCLSSSCSDSCPLSQWCHPTISSSVILFSCLQSFPASGSFPMSWLSASDGQSIGASASASVLPMTIQGWFPLGLTDLISLLTKESVQAWINKARIALSSHAQVVYDYKWCV